MFEFNRKDRIIEECLLYRFFFCVILLRERGYITLIRVRLLVMAHREEGEYIIQFSVDHLQCRNT